MHNANQIDNNVLYCDMIFLYRTLKQERDRLTQIQAPSCLAGLPTQVSLDAVANSREQGNDGTEEDADATEHRRKRRRDEEDGEVSTKRRSKHEETGVGGIRKLVEFCSKDIK